MRQSRQGGSTVGYILTSIVLIGMLAGGVYMLRHGTLPTAEVATESQPTKEEQSDQSGNTDDNKTEKTQVPVASSPQSDERRDEDPQQAADTTSASNNTPAVVPTELPQTGLTDVSSVMILVVLAAVVAAYVRSRRPALT